MSTPFTSFRNRVEAIARPLLYTVLALGLVIRFALIRENGFSNDIAAFASWAITLATHPLSQFYGSAGFADYPPGYFYLLRAIGVLWTHFFAAHDAGNGALYVLVKVPGILADLGIGALLYAVVARLGGKALGLLAAALYVLDPATIFISAVWGQVDAVAGFFALLAIYALLRSGDDERGTMRWSLLAWTAFSYSLLIKPQAAVLIPLLLAYAFVGTRWRATSLRAAGAGILAAFGLAWLVAVPFHPSFDPVAVLAWLYERYQFGASVYPVNSANAMNLWTITAPFWQSDSATIFGIPQGLWGIGLVVAATALVTWRYLQERTEGALLEAAAIALLAFYMLATRMHERYSFDGVLFCIAAIGVARRYLWGAIVLSIVLFVNLQYAYAYLRVVTDHTPGVNAMDLWPTVTHPLSLVAVLTFFALSYGFLSIAGESEPGKRDFDPSVEAIKAWFARGARRWFAPRNGLAALAWPLDYLISGALTVASFVLSFVNYWKPGQKIFDEIYFARAAEEYLRNVRIYENTHPPLTKLLITASTWLFGGLPRGDNAHGWRFVDVLFGALVIPIVYAFARRVTRSTLFATIATTLLLFDGMHYVQSRIATPEGIVIVFSVAAVYAFYRFWIASQVNERQHVDLPWWAYPASVALSLGIGSIFGALYGAIFTKLNPTANPTVTTIAEVLIALYVAVGLYLLGRLVVLPKIFGDGRREFSFPDGSVALVGPDGVRVETFDGGRIEPDRKAPVRGSQTTVESGALVARIEPGVEFEYRRDGSVRYATPDGAVLYTGNRIESEAGEREDGRSAGWWLIAFTVALGCLIASKWYGVMGFGVSWLVLILVASQRFLKKKIALWGNPRGFRLDVALLSIVFISMTVYMLAWVPDIARNAKSVNEIHNFNDVVYRQYTMFEYHDHLKATHPYSSKFWEWPLDVVPVAYYYKDLRTNPTDPNGCCVREITSMPNPFILWFGLLAIPIVGVLAWRERHKGYALLVLDYLLQWLPWSLSPRIAFEYHYYVDIPLVCICNAIVLQRLWQWGDGQEETKKMLARGLVGAYVLLVIAGFIYFFPILSATPITWNAWHQRMWFSKWIIGPG